MLFDNGIIKTPEAAGRKRYSDRVMRNRTSILLRLPIHLLPHTNHPNRYHLLLTTFAATIIMLGRHRRVIPRPATLAALVDIRTPVAATTTVTTAECARATRVARFLPVRKTLGAPGAIVRGAVGGEAGAEGSSQGQFAEYWPKHGQASREDADVALDAQPDARINDRVCKTRISVYDFSLPEGERERVYMIHPSLLA